VLALHIPAGVPTPLVQLAATPQLAVEATQVAVATP
jgi:hypothetical protein